MIAMPRLLALGGAVVLALVLMTGEGSARYQSPEARADLEDLVKLLRNKVIDQAAVTKKVAAIKNKHDLEDLMAVYKATTSKVSSLRGAGYDPAKKGPGDGIEKRMIDLGKKELPKDKLGAEKDLLLRAAYYNLALYEISKGFGPPKKPGKGIKEWTKHNAELKDGTEELMKAVKANDPKALKKAMTRIHAGCNECHTDFR